ncbi:pentapeptide repeat-containing protein [Nostoc sp. TCL240-02]|uniref:pentapeptide repeat-containing protein n=1 Tax=Nostoc sp. TCL240-02 TaxID=2572090 RepID=UPI00157FA269|nr:pentapeptide repeat-containing protein [Nostoc sp. TCL240-02]QKQ75620.1 pentapeptide repeat-containing protein [Nostoc sp. TCL240-02]
MIDPSPGIKKKKITIPASLEGVYVAEKALIRLGFESKSNFAKSQLISRTTVTKFFLSEPIQLDSFKRICETLKLNWREIAGLIEEKQPSQLPTSSYSNPSSDGVVEQVQPEYRRLTVIDKQSKKIKAVITLQGDIDSVQSWKFIQSALREYSGDTIEITDIKEGSIKLFVEGSPEDIEQLVSRIKSGELKEVTGFPVEDVQILSESSDNDESSESNEKWRLVQEIISQPINMRRLSGVDLSDADLSGADLSDANLIGADLIDADLIDANLIFANLIGANLNRANLSLANLRFANLSSADLSRANLRGARLGTANLSGATLGTANLSSAELSRANLSDTNLSRANLSDTNLSRANLSGAKLNNANLSDTNLSRANLSRANLSDADLSRANLSDADLRNANLSGAVLNDADLRNANLSDADLNNTNVVDALFGGNTGLTDYMKRDLERRGAIFGDRPPVRSPK